MPPGEGQAEMGRVQQNPSVRGEGGICKRVTPRAGGGGRRGVACG